MRVSERDICEALDALAESSMLPENRSAVERLLARVGIYPAARRELVSDIKKSVKESTYSVPSEKVASMIIVHCLLLEHLH